MVKHSKPDLKLLRRSVDVCGPSLTDEVKSIVQNKRYFSHMNRRGLNVNRHEQTWSINLKCCFLEVNQVLQEKARNPAITLSSLFLKFDFRTSSNHTVNFRNLNTQNI